MSRVRAKAAPRRLRPLKLPPLERGTTTGGAQVIVAPRTLLPMATVHLVVRAGSAWDPPGRRGLSELTARLIRRGAGGRTADELNEAVEFVGGSLQSSSSEDYLSVTLTAPSDDLAAMMEVVGAIACEPTNSPEELESGRGRVLAQIAHELDDPASLADRAIDRALFGEHPYGHDALGVSADVKAATREDVAGFHRRGFVPANCCLIVVGAVDPERTFAAADRAFAGLPRGERTPDVPAVPDKPASTGDLFVVDKPEQTQTQVRIGAIGVRRSDPDYHAAIVFNAALGGSFTSRLMTQIRVKRGLSYGAGSQFDPLGAGGSFSISSFTKTESTRELLDVALAEVAKMRRSGPTPAEVSMAQLFVAGLYPSRFEGNESLATALAQQWLYALPADWHQGYRERIQAVTRAQAMAAAARHLFDKDRVIALVGNAERILPQLEGLGRVRVLQIPELG